MATRPIYLSGVRSEVTDAFVTYFGDLLSLGLLVQPGTRQYLAHAGRYHWIGIDNGCFRCPEAFDPAGYLDLIRDAIGRELNVLFAAAPDRVGDWAATLQVSRPFLPQIRQAGAPAALVLQDGATPETVPWDECDALFIGGSTEWKLGPQAREICAEANRRSTPARSWWLHMGRVNSLERLRIARDFGCDSADGTYLRFVAQVEGAQHVARWLHDLQAEARDEERARLLPSRDLFEPRPGLTREQAERWLDYYSEPPLGETVYGPKPDVRVGRYTVPAAQFNRVVFRAETLMITEVLFSWDEALNGEIDETERTLAEELASQFELPPLVLVAAMRVAAGNLARRTREGEIQVEEAGRRRHPVEVAEDEFGPVARILGVGGYGVALLLGDGRVVKYTSSPAEQYCVTEVTRLQTGGDTSPHLPRVMEAGPAPAGSDKPWRYVREYLEAIPTTMRHAQAEALVREVVEAGRDIWIRHGLIPLDDWPRNWGRRPGSGELVLLDMACSSERKAWDDAEQDRPVPVREAVQSAVARYGNRPSTRRSGKPLRPDVTGGPVPDLTGLAARLDQGEAGELWAYAVTRWLSAVVGMPQAFRLAPEATARRLPDGRYETRFPGRTPDEPLVEVMDRDDLLAQIASMLRAVSLRERRAGP